MSEERNPPRRPFGERGEEERQQPFGANPPRRRVDIPASPGEPAQAGEDRPVEDVEKTLLAGEPEGSDNEVRVPFVRLSAPARLPEREEEPPEAGEAGREDGQPGPRVQGEPLHAPALIRVRERSPAAAPGRSILKQRAGGEAGQTVTPGAPPEPPPAIPAALTAIRLSVVVRTLFVIFGVAALVATMFTWWTPNSFLPAESVEQLSVALATQSGFNIAMPPTPTPFYTPSPVPVPAPTLVGIVSGHRGLHPDTSQPDPGAVCADGLTEVEVNSAIAERVADLLRGQGYEIEVFDEFDPRLQGLRALALVSIHSDSCEPINDQATGFKVASFAESRAPEQDTRLVRCLIDRYAMTTGLTFHPSVTFDMTQYHSFRELAPGTPGAIIEVGFLYLDRELLTGSPDVVALGVARGMLCYLRNEPVDPNLVVPTVGEEPETPEGTPIP